MFFSINLRDFLSLFTFHLLWKCLYADWQTWVLKFRLLTEGDVAKRNSIKSLARDSMRLYPTSTACRQKRNLYTMAPKNYKYQICPKCCPMEETTNHLSLLLQFIMRNYQCTSIMITFIKIRGAFFSKCYLWSVWRPKAAKFSIQDIFKVYLFHTMHTFSLALVSTNHHGIYINYCKENN